VCCACAVSGVIVAPYQVARELLDTERSYVAAIKLLVAAYKVSFTCCHDHIASYLRTYAIAPYVTQVPLENEANKPALAPLDSASSAPIMLMPVVNTDDVRMS
jgi:hypothetical protein